MDSIKNLKRLKIVCMILANLMMIVQVVLIVLVLLFSLYSFLHLLDNTALDFMNPLVQMAKSFVKFLFGNTIKASLPEIDGEIVIFIVMDVILTFVVVQLKMALKAYQEEIDKKIVEEKAKVEVKFNRALDEELHKSIQAYSSFMLGCAFKVSPLVADSMQIYGVQAIDTKSVGLEIAARFVGAIKSVPGIKISREDGNILITSAKFENIDLVLATVLDVCKHLKKEYRSKKITIKTRLAIEAYRPMTPFEVVYKTVKPLLELNLGNDALCYGNVKSRYAMVENPVFNIEVKGKYDIDDSEETIYSLVKKS